MTPRSIRTLCWTLCLALLTVGIASADPKPKKKKHKPKPPPVAVSQPKADPAPDPAANNNDDGDTNKDLGPTPPKVDNSPKVDDSIKSVYVVPRKVKGTEDDAALLKGNKLESVEVRFYTKEQRKRGGLYIEVIHHWGDGGKTADETLGGNPFTFKKAGPNGEDVIHYGLSYDDYNYSTGLLKADFDKLWGNWIYARNGGALIATGASIFALYGIANWMKKEEVFALGFLAGKAIELYKSKIGFAIMIYPTYLAVKGMYNSFIELENNGRTEVPIFGKIHVTNGFKGKEEAERDWLYRVFSVSYANATYGTLIDEKQFDVDGTYNQFHDVLAGKKVDLPDPDARAKELAAQPAPAVNTVPMKKDLSFAITAMKNFFKEYAEDNAEDDIPTPKIPAVK